jgi:hypothetical protein
LVECTDAASTCRRATAPRSDAPSVAAPRLQGIGRTASDLTIFPLAENPALPCLFRKNEKTTDMERDDAKRGAAELAPQA